MSQKKNYNFGTLRLKKDTIEYLKDLREAFEDSYQKKFTMDDFIKQMAASIEDGDPGVWEIYCMKQEQRTELQERIAQSQKLREQRKK